MRRQTLHMSWLSYFLTLLFVTSIGAVEKAAHTYQVVKIIDGDTFDATDGNITFRVRIAGMDAPEKGSPFSKLAIVELAKHIEGKEIEIQTVGRGIDRYNRILGQVIVDRQDVGIELITMGLATYYRPRCVDYPANKKAYDYDPVPYIAAEYKARSQKLYLWSDPKTILPCEVRRRSDK